MSLSLIRELLETVGKLEVAVASRDREIVELKRAAHGWWCHWCNTMIGDRALTAKHVVNCEKRPENIELASREKEIAELKAQVESGSMLCCEVKKRELHGELAKVREELRTARELILEFDAWGKEPREDPTCAASSRTLSLFGKLRAFLNPPKAEKAREWHEHPLESYTCFTEPTHGTGAVRIDSKLHCFGCIQRALGGKP